MAERLSKLKLAIEQIVVDHDWTNFVNLLCGKSSLEIIHKGESCSSQHKERQVLGYLWNFVHMGEPILMS